MGEAQSKCEHLAGAPLLPAVAVELHKLYLAKGALASTAIEGNTLSEAEVIKLLEGKLKLPESKEYLEKEVQNLVRACNAIVDGCVSLKPRGIKQSLVKNFNRLVLQGLKLEPEVVPGEVRRHEVGVARYKGAPPEDCDYLLDKLCRWLSTDFRSDASPVAFVILKAVLAHLYLAWIHPFGDGNGRTARLVEFYFLICAGVPTPAAHLLSNHYNETRSEYYRQLDAASRSGGDVIPFIQYAVRGFVDGLRSQIDMVRAQQLHVAWRNYVYERFRDRNSRGDDRKRKLILDLSQEEEPVTRDGLTVITPRVAAAYAGRSTRTLTRDLNELATMGLLVEKGREYRAKTELIQAFLPLHSKPDPSGEASTILREFELSIAPHEHECVDCGRMYDCSCDDPSENLTKVEAESRDYPVRCPTCDSNRIQSTTV